MKIIEEVLPSGLKIILVPRVGVSSVTGLFAVRAGWNYESKENSGAAHFLEHMAFKGTHRRPDARLIAEEIERHGGDFNAGTDAETTVYSVEISHRQTQLVIDILSDVIINSRFMETDIDDEKQVIIEESRGIFDEPAAFLYSVVWINLLYGDQPAGWLNIGTEDDISGIDREKLLKFMNGLYTAENSVICLAGKIQRPQRIINKINSCFGMLMEGKPAIIKPPIICRQQEPGFRLVSKDTQQSHILLGVRTFDINDPRKYALQILANVLGGKMSSRLFYEIREKRGLAYHIDTMAHSLSDTGNLFTYGGISRDKTVEAVRAIMDEYRRISSERISDRELSDAKSYIIGTIERYLESSDYIANSLVNQYVSTGKIKTLDDVIGNISAVTAEDVLDVAQEIFVDHKLNLAVVGPHDAGAGENLRGILEF